MCKANLSLMQTNFKVLLTSSFKGKMGETIPCRLMISAVLWPAIFLLMSNVDRSLCLKSNLFGNTKYAKNAISSLVCLGQWLLLKQYAE